MICLKDGCNCVGKCGHLFHKNCLTEWLKRKSNCPVCLEELGGEDINPIEEGD